MAEPTDPDGRDADPRAADTAPPRRGWWRRLTEGPADLPGGGLSDAAALRGWPVQDQDDTLAPVLAQSPMRLTPEHLAAPVTRGRAGTWDLLAFDVRYRMPRGELSAAQYAVTAVPVPLPLPALQVAPRRFLTHGGAGLLVLPTGDDAFDARWRVLVGEDTAEIRGLVGPQLRAVLLAGPDLDELWTAGGQLAASRAGSHHDAVLTQHGEQLTAALAGLRQAL